MSTCHCGDKAFPKDTGVGTDFSVLELLLSYNHAICLNVFQSRITMALDVHMLKLILLVWYVCKVMFGCLRIDSSFYLTPGFCFCPHDFHLPDFLFNFIKPAAGVI